MQSSTGGPILNWCQGAGRKLRFFLGGINRQDAENAKTQRTPSGLVEKPQSRSTALALCAEWRLSPHKLGALGALAVKNTPGRRPIADRGGLRRECGVGNLRGLDCRSLTGDFGGFALAQQQHA